MPGTFRPLTFAAALLFATMAEAFPASAEMTEADKAGMQTFAACLDKTGGDEAGCIKVLGRYAWYPRDDAVCAAVAARVGETLAVLVNDGDQAKPQPRLPSDTLEMKNLFFNERCARLDLPHNSEAAKDPNEPGLRQEYNACLAEAGASQGSCNERMGVHRFYPADNEDCEFNLSTIAQNVSMGLRSFWERLFDNERCRRLGLVYAEPKPLKPVIGPTSGDLASIDAFAGCLDENGNDEVYCIRKLGRDGWYPRDDKTCKSVAARVDKILAVNGDPVWRDLFQNERCARLGMTNSSLALPDKNPVESKLWPVECRKKRKNTRCYEIYGRHEWNPVGAQLVCEHYANVPIKYPDSAQKEWWDYWFKNERCRRIGRPYFDAASGVAREATVEIVR